MKITFIVTIESLKKYFCREIVVDENINLDLFCELIVVSLNGSGKESRCLEYNNQIYKWIYESDSEDKSLLDYKIKDLDLAIGDKIKLQYNYCWIFNLEVTNMEKESPLNDFAITYGHGIGIIESVDLPTNLKMIIDSQYDARKRAAYNFKEYRDYLNMEFDLEVLNKKIEDYKKIWHFRLKPKNYIMNVTLNGAAREIKRKICVNSNLLIGDFCKYVSLSMQADLSHSYGLKIGSKYMDEMILNYDLNYLDLEKGHKIKVIYDYGDNWIFNVSISKVNDGYVNKNFEVLDGKGYGIIDDCGGLYELFMIFNGQDDSWGKYNIDDFDLEEINKKI